MENYSALTLITGMYLLLNGVRVLSYIPQMYAISKEHNKVTAISLTTWTFWAAANFATAIYAHIEVHDTMLAIMNYGNGICCAIVVAMVLYKRKKYLYSVDTLIEIHNKTLGNHSPLGSFPKPKENLSVFVESEESSIEIKDTNEIKM